MERVATPEPVHRLPSIFANLAVVMAALAALVLAVFSLRWPLFHDTPIFHYGGYLMQDLGRVPYRDFFEINPPGTLLLYAFIHSLTGGASLALRVIDLVVLPN